MDRTAFPDTEANPTWWLLQQETDYPLVESRKALRVALGYDPEAQLYLENSFSQARGPSEDWGSWS
jgi:hypothetical protein